MSALKHAPGIYRVEVVDDAIEVTPMDGPPASIPLALALAAPEMALTLERLDGWLASSGYDVEHPWRVAIRAALKKAGVL